MKTQAGWPSLLAINQNLSFLKHFLFQLGKTASHNHQVIAINFRSLLYRELLWNFSSSPRVKRTMNMRMDKFRPFSQQLFQPARDAQEENSFDEDEDVFISN